MRIGAKRALNIFYFWKYIFQYTDMYCIKEPLSSLKQQINFFFSMQRAFLHKNYLVNNKPRLIVRTNFMHFLTKINSLRTVIILSYSTMSHTLFQIRKKSYQANSQWSRGHSFLVILTQCQRNSEMYAIQWLLVTLQLITTVDHRIFTVWYTQNHKFMDFFPLFFFFFTFPSNILDVSQFCPDTHNIILFCLLLFFCKFINGPLKSVVLHGPPVAHPCTISFYGFKSMLFEV